MPRERADSGDLMDELREICQEAGLLTGDKEMLEMLRGLTGTKVSRSDKLLASQVRDVRVCVRATEKVFGDLFNEKGKPWLLKPKKL